MTNITKSKAAGRDMADMLDKVQLSDSKRALAKSYAQEAELFADRIWRAESAVVSAITGFEHGCGTLARRVRSSFKHLVHH